MSWLLHSKKPNFSPAIIHMIKADCIQNFRFSWKINYFLPKADHLCSWNPATKRFKRRSMHSEKLWLPESNRLDRPRVDLAPTSSDLHRNDYNSVSFSKFERPIAFWRLKEVFFCTIYETVFKKLVFMPGGWFDFCQNTCQKSNPPPSA